MANMIEINGYQAVVQYDPDIDMFRGEFVNLNGGADFYAKDVEGLRREGEISLKVFLDMVREDAVEARKRHSDNQDRAAQIRFQFMLARDRQIPA
ncbi:MAG: type II toxin-antitoxin system HicB family antitoxin [Anaerolineae bacterium]